MKTSIAVLFVVALALALLANRAVADGPNVLFRGYDPHIGLPVVIEQTDQGYTMDGLMMEVLRHPNIRHKGLSLTFTAKDRVGPPDMYYVLDEKRQALAVYVNCESGPCTYKRSIRSQ